MTIFRPLWIARSIRSAASTAPGKSSGSCKLPSRASRNANARFGSSIPRLINNCAKSGESPDARLKASIRSGSSARSRQRAFISVTVPVRPDGKISTPLDEDMVAVGKTPSQLAHDIEAKLAEYVRSPHVNVIVTKPASLFSQVKVIGQVTKPAAIAYHEGMTVLDAVLAVGGLTQYAAGNRARIVRMENGTEKDIPVRLGALVNSGDMSQNLPLKSGDVLVVPESRF